MMKKRESSEVTGFTSEKSEDRLNREKGHLDEVDKHNCNICNNKGFSYIVKENGSIVTRECKCMNTRRILRRLAKSGLSNIIHKCKFSNYETTENWQTKILEKAENVCNNGSWFFIGGQSGCGKTHICTAICGDYLKKGNDVMYMLWLNDVKQLKNTVNDYETHSELMEKYKKATVLYIDDFFKNGKDKDGCTQPPTPSDIQMAYDIINYRYNNDLTTIISSERTSFEISSIDEAVAGRILEKCNFGEYAVNVGKDVSKNYRMKSVVSL